MEWFRICIIQLTLCLVKMGVETILLVMLLPVNSSVGIASRFTEHFRADGCISCSCLSSIDKWAFLARRLFRPPTPPPLPPQDDPVPFEQKAKLLAARIDGALSL